MNEKRVRLRFAPSPTGGLHMGGVRTALFNYLFARKHGGDFLLRIEDTDQTRYVKGAEEYIVEALKWTGIVIDEGVSVGGPHAPYRQSERKELGIYAKYANQLIDAGHAYYAFDTAEELDAMRKRLEAAKVTAPQYNSVSRQHMRNSLTLPESEWKRLLEEKVPYVVRLKVPRNEEIRFHDLIRGWVVVHSSHIDDKVLLKSDGMPTYHLAHIVDDFLMKISHVVRGEEWLPSAPAHILIYRYLGLEHEIPQLAHLPLILKPDGNGKLSKRDKSGLPMFPLNWFDESSGESYTGYRESGFFPEAFANMLAMLGWNPGTAQEIFSMKDLIESFSFERVNKSGAKFDPVKTKWFNQQYLRMKSNAELAVLLQPVIAGALKEKAAHYPISFLERFAGLMKEKVHFIPEMYTSGKFFFERPLTYDAEVIQKKWNAQVRGCMEKVTLAYKALDVFEAAAIEEEYKKVCADCDLTPGQMMQITRVCLTGASAGPALFDSMELLGKDEVVARFNMALKTLA